MFKNRAQLPHYSKTASKMKKKKTAAKRKKAAKKPVKKARQKKSKKLQKAAKKAFKKQEAKKPAKKTSGILQPALFEETIVQCPNCGKSMRLIKAPEFSTEGMLCQSCSKGEIDLSQE